MYKIKTIDPSQIPATLILVREVFLEFEAPDYSEDGIAEFLKYLTIEKMKDRLRGTHFCLVATIDKDIVGAIEVRDCRHISLLFVHSRFHRQGIGRKLWLTAFSIAQTKDATIKKFTVNSSPFALPIYKRFGFRSLGPEKEVHGIRFFPMEFKVRKKNPT